MLAGDQRVKIQNLNNSTLAAMSVGVGAKYNLISGRLEG